ncbi:MAG: NAD(P)H-hydrate dehydratase [Holdemanella sp.]|nr:NAD(P)H-hydrate dehydratase [Holdemanella sp.]
MSNIQYIHTAKDARMADFETIHTHGIPSLILMEHAAIESVKIIEKHLTDHSRICIVCGPGNNGGDGLAIARLLAQKNKMSNVLIPSIDKMSADEKKQYEMVKNYDLFITEDMNDIKKDIQYSDIIIDCIFGNGLARDITGKYEELIQWINDSKATVFAIDIPSGIHATTGKKMHCAICADYTIALDCFKLGHFQNDGLEYCGKLECVDIGILKSVHKQIDHPVYFINEQLSKELLPVRSNLSHKGTFKKGLLIGGSQSMHGALTLAANACYRSGIGTLTLMVPDCIGDILASKMDFAMQLRKSSKDGFFDRPDQEALFNEINSFQFIAIGNGIGRNQASIDYVETVLKTDKPVLIDADGLWALGNNTNLLHRKAPVILTPHVKEMSFLCKESVKDILEHPYESAFNFVSQYPDVTIILKSSTSFIVSRKESFILHRPNSALAKGGSGDILCGITMGMCGQTNDYIKACAISAYIHSECATIKKDPASLMPDECVEQISTVLESLRKD